VGEENIKIPARAACVFANKTGVIGFVDRRLQRFFFADVFAANVDVGSDSLRSMYADHGA